MSTFDVDHSSEEELLYGSVCALGIGVDRGVTDEIFATSWLDSTI